MDRQQSAIDASEAARGVEEQKELDKERNAELTNASKHLQEEQHTYDMVSEELENWITLMNEAETEEQWAFYNGHVETIQMYADELFTSL